MHKKIVNIAKNVGLSWRTELLVKLYHFEYQNKLKKYCRHLKLLSQSIQTILTVRTDFHINLYLEIADFLLIFDFLASRSPIQKSDLDST